MKTIKCDQCGEEIEIPDADSPENYTCPECGKRFIDDRATL